MTRPKRNRPNSFWGMGMPEWFKKQANERKRLIKQRRRKDKKAGRR